MPRPSKINVKFRGGYRGRYIPVRKLIERGIPFDIMDYREDASSLKDRDTYCIMQIRIGEKPYVTWHASDVLTAYLNDCRADERDQGRRNFPITGCLLTVSDDGSYMIEDAPARAAVPTEKEIMALAESEGRHHYGR